MIGKSIKKIVTICIALACYASAYVVWNGYYDDSVFDNYSTQNTFKISTPAQLAGLSRVVEDGKNFYRKKVVLTADICIPMALPGNYLVKVGSYSKAVKIR